MTLLRQFYAKLMRHRTRLAKFGVIGLLGVLVDVGGFNLLTFAGELGPLTAKFISAGVSIVVSWLGNRYWTFGERRRESVRREFIAFLAISIIGLGISLGTLALSHDVLGLHSHLADNISANVIGLGLATMFRYWSMHKHVFTGTTPVAKPKAPVAEPALRR